MDNFATIILTLKCTNKNLKPKIMKSKIARIVILPMLLILVSSCSVIEGIFKAGMGVGVFIVISILAVIAFVISKFMRK